MSLGDGVSGGEDGARHGREGDGAVGSALLVIGRPAALHAVSAAAAGPDRPRPEGSLGHKVTENLFAVTWSGSDTCRLHQEVVTWAYS